MMPLSPVYRLWVKILRRLKKYKKGFSQDELKLDINSIVRFRDLVSHHYDLLDYEVIFNICKAEIPIVTTAVKKYLATSEDLNK